MKGAAELIAMRCRGRVPTSVFIDFETGTEAWRDWHTETPARAKLCLERGEAPATVDLRCVVGLTVILNDTGPERVAALRDACIDVGARRVVAHCLEQVGGGDWVAYRLLWCTDTQGEWTWPSLGKTWVK